MPDKQIEQLKLLLATEAELEISEHQFTKGEMVKIVAGPLQGLIGELVDFQTQKRLLLKIDHVGQSVLININSIFTEPF